MNFIHNDPFQGKKIGIKPSKKSNFFGVQEQAVFTKYYERREELREKRIQLANTYNMSQFVKKAPNSIRPYLELARVDKPIGTLLLYIPCAYSICLAAPPGQLPSLYYLGLFGLGAFLMRGAGCVINDLWDRDLDKRVERTKNRPIASGAVSEKNAIKLLAVQLSLSLGILLTLNPTCIMIGCVAMLPVVVYPLAKRFTMFPQAVLGLTFNMGALMGYVAVTNTINWPVQLSLYASCFLWTMYYDTVYAFQDVKDDVKAGIKSTARLFSRYTEEELKEMPLEERIEMQNVEKQRILLFLRICAVSHVVLFYVAGHLKYLDGPFTLACLIAGFQLVVQSSVIEPTSRQACWEAFVANKWIGLILVTGIIVGTITQTQKLSKEKKMLLERRTALDKR
nr:4-hydroxybenzoate polyprenyltransferase, mitochondrial-like [Ciona intestinalis]|eukprot:XP_002130409.1 4-hydroxybenzoate polyprenyltransferase, mitochondrial-like [Ciona intestinalis]